MCDQSIASCAPESAIGHGIRFALGQHMGSAARDMIDLQSFMWVQGSDEYEA